MELKQSKLNMLLVFISSHLDDNKSETLVNVGLRDDVGDSALNEEQGIRKNHINKPALWVNSSGPLWPPVAPVAPAAVLLKS